MNFGLKMKLKYKLMMAEDRGECGGRGGMYVGGLKEVS